MIVILCSVVSAVTLLLYVRYHPVFGGLISSEERHRLEQSPNFKKGLFRNLNRSYVLMSLKKLPELMRERKNNRHALRPKDNIEVVSFDKDNFLNGDKPQFIWYGHSTLLFRVDGLTIAVDPMFGDDVTPMLPKKNKRFSDGIPDVMDQLPDIDFVLLTHDHYDHLDYRSIKKLTSKIVHFYGPLGIGRHLKKWGVAADKITELDWYERVNVSNLEFIFTPSKHYSGRRFSDRNLGLWGGWIIRSSSVAMYFTGDGGYDEEFKKIGEQYGPFDWCFSECGQYNELWRDNHMFPNESAQAAIDSQSKVVIPIHWGGFTLAMHPWREPVEQFVDSISDEDIKVCTPQIGAIVQLGSEEEAHSDWYKSVH
jgi:L-ascorbate metabolism protein UlaG (beta-lactamase superfamily)